MSDEKDSKFFYMNLKKRVSKGGKVFYTGKFAYACDLIGFEKNDGSGDITLWLSPKDMDQMKNKGYGQKQQAAQPQQAPRNYAPPPQTQKPQQQAAPSGWDPDDPGF